MIIRKVASKILPSYVKRLIKVKMAEHAPIVMRLIEPTYWLSREPFAADVKVMRSSGTRMLFRMADSFTLPQIRRSTQERVSKQIHSSEINWATTSSNDQCTIINVISSDHIAIINRLKESFDFKHWYCEKLTKKGVSQKSATRLVECIPEEGDSGYRLYERVALNAETSFRSTARQGVEIHVWDRTKDEVTGRDIIAARIWNARASKLPDPNSDREEFGTQVDIVNSAHVSQVSFPIDVVYTWVNGKDREWLAKKARALGESAVESFVKEAADGARFADHDELRYSLRSIEQFAPWVNKIYIVTDGQVPEWLQPNERITVVDHRQIFPSANDLPTFNSHAIEASLHRIPNLSEHFLYINDDVLFTRPVRPEQFFYPSGISKIFWSRAQVDFWPAESDEGASTIAAKNARRLIVQDGEMTFSRKFFHTPASLRRSVCYLLESSFEFEYSRTRSAVFRSDSDIAAAGSFYFNHALINGRAVPGSIRYDYIDPATSDGRVRMFRVLTTNLYDCIVINAFGSDCQEYTPEDVDNYIRECLHKLLPVPACWELL